MKGRGRKGAGRPNAAPPSDLAPAPGTQPADAGPELVPDPAAGPTVTPDPRIVDVALDERTILWRNPDVEQERRVAIFDLLEGNRFEPAGPYADGYAGPYRILLRIEEGRLAIDISTEDGRPLETVILALTPFRRLIRDYFAVCESYYRAIREATPAHIETVDMARRAIHNEAAQALLDRLAAKVTVDFATARRLFTLICVLHIKA